jgi:hypothetical protein
MRWFLGITATLLTSVVSLTLAWGFATLGVWATRANGPHLPPYLASLVYLGAPIGFFGSLIFLGCAVIFVPTFGIAATLDWADRKS